MVDISNFLDRKYDILGQTANSEQQLRQAQSNLINSQAATNPGEAAAREAAGFGSAAASQGSANLLNTNASLAPAQSQSEIALRGSQAGATEAQTRATNSEQQFLPDFLSQGIFRNLNRGTPGFSTGTSAVTPSAPTGPAPGPTDTVPAMLTPHEAVLNRGAVEHVGRHAIDVLNAIGTIKMNSAQQPVETPAPATPVGYAQGSANVGSIDPIPGQGGTWGQPQVGNSGNTDLRAKMGMGVPRPAPSPTPAPKPAGYAGGTSDAGGPGMPGDNLAQIQADMQKWAAFGGATPANPTATDRANPKTNAPGMANGPQSDAKKPMKEQVADNNAQTPLGKRPMVTGNNPMAPTSEVVGKMVQAGKGQPMTSEAGYAKGTSNVGGKAKGAPSKGGKGAGGPPSNMPAPEAVQAVMAMQQAGKGMPPQQPGMSPMPMPMPQVAGH